MKGAEFIREKNIASLKVGSESRFFSATGSETDCGLTSDIYFVKTRDLLERIGHSATVVTAEIFASREGILAGIDEALHLLRNRSLQIWALREGDTMQPREVVMRIRGKYSDFAIYENPLLGILASSSGWAGADAFGVGSYISRAPAIDMTMDLKEVSGHALAKKGRIPGLTENSRLAKIG